MHSMPCQRLNTSGYFLGSVLNLMVPRTCRSTLSSRWIAPVRKLPPAGTTTCPPPALVQAVTALANAAGQAGLPAPFAPHPGVSKFLLREVGGFVRAGITRTWSHPDALRPARPPASPTTSEHRSHRRPPRSGPPPCRCPPRRRRSTSPTPPPAGPARAGAP